MKKTILFLSLFLFLIGCEKVNNDLLVKNITELNEAISKAQAGDEIVMANGIWQDIQIVFTGKGTKTQPITLRAESPGEVFIEGESDLKFGGEFLVVQGLYFRNGYTPSKSIIEFRIDKDHVSNNCRVTECVINSYNQLHRDRPDHWVEFWGRHNQLDHCYIAGKANKGPTVRVYISGNESIRNYHQIVNNHFGPRQRKGGPSAETMQIGDSGTSMSPSHTLVANNLLERCNGEVEVISSKTNFNEFRNNVFYKCEGSLVMRHGNYCIMDGNYFIGDEHSDNIGGIRIINTGHWVINNYFINLKGQNFRSPLAIMNGIPKSPLNRYNQVTDVVVAYNTWINCKSPWQIGVGSNVSQSDVLPLSEIRSARPKRTTIANNIIYNVKGDESPYTAHDKMDGILFKKNLISNQQTAFEDLDGLKATDFEMKAINEYLFVPKAKQLDIDPYEGFEFDKIDQDLLGNKRSTLNLVGAISQYDVQDPLILDKTKYGCGWYNPEKEKRKIQEHKATVVDNNLGSLIKSAGEGDIIILEPGIYKVQDALVVDKKITIKSKENKNNTQIIYSGSPETAAFQMHPDGLLELDNISLKGSKNQFAFATLKENMSSGYSLKVTNSEISDFKYVLKAYKESFADNILFKNTILKDCQNGIELSEETNDKGDYNVEFLTIDSCEFNNIQMNVIDYYRGGYDESTIGGNLSVTNSTFTRCGKDEPNRILLNTRGIVNVNISNNQFKNNPVKLVALLWGAKNNTHSDNEIINSGKIIVEENLKLKLLY